MKKKKEESFEEKSRKLKAEMNETYRKDAENLRDKLFESGIDRLQSLNTNKLIVPQERNRGEVAILSDRITTTEVPGPGTKIELSDRDFCMRYAKDEDFEQLRKIIEKRPGPLEFSYWLCPKCGFRAKLPGRCAGDRDIGCFRCNPRNLEGFPLMKELTKRAEIEAFKKAEKEGFERQLAGMKKSAEVAKRTFEHEVAMGKFK